MLQFVDRKKTPPSYLEKVTLYLHPPEEAEQFIKSRLVHHAQYTTLFGVGNGSAQE